jgi:hypothetical protein
VSLINLSHHLKRRPPPPHIVLYDDTGIAAWSPYGGRIDMPTMDKLAASGLTYSQCTPRRSAPLPARACSPGAVSRTAPSTKWRSASAMTSTSTWRNSAQLCLHASNWEIAGWMHALAKMLPLRNSCPRSALSKE